MLSQGTLAGLKWPDLVKSVVTVPLSAGRSSPSSLVCREPVTAGLCSLLLPSVSLMKRLWARWLLFAFQHCVVLSPLLIPSASCHHGPLYSSWKQTDQSAGDLQTLFCRADGNSWTELVNPMDPLADFSVFLLLAC